MTTYNNTYLREILPGVRVDVYDVLRAFEVHDPAIAHAIKKLLADGTGDKDRETNIVEAKACIDRYLSRTKVTQQRMEPRAMNLNTTFDPLITGTTACIEDDYTQVSRGL